MPDHLTEAYAEQFLCGEPVLLGRFGAVSDYGAPELIGYKAASIRAPNWRDARPDVPATVTIDRAVFEVVALATPRRDGIDGFTWRRVVRLRPGDDPAYLRGWRAAYHG